MDNLLISNLVVDTQRDGFDIDCCRNVIIKGCRLNCPWDDAICLKASYALGRFKDTEDVVIADCIVTAFKEGTMPNPTTTFWSISPSETCGRSVWTRG